MVKPGAVQYLKIENDEVAGMRNRRRMLIFAKNLGFVFDDPCIRARLIRFACVHTMNPFRMRSTSEDYRTHFRRDADQRAPKCEAITATKLKEIFLVPQSAISVFTGDVDANSITARDKARQRCLPKLSQDAFIFFGCGKSHKRRDQL